MVTQETKEAMSKRTAAKMQAAHKAASGEMSKLSQPDSGRVYKWRDELVYIRHGDDGRWVMGHEWYRMESYSDDDLSSTGFRLPHQPGSARVCYEIEAGSFAGLLDAIRGR